MTTNLTLKLELRNLEQRGGLGQIALSEMDGGGALVWIERERGGTFRPTVEWKWNKLLVVVRGCGRGWSDQSEMWMFVWIFHFVLYFFLKL